MKVYHFLSLFVVGVLGLTGCGDKKGDEGSGGGGSSVSASPVKLSLTSSGLSSAIIRPSTTNCNLNNGAINLSGKCYTPISLIGKVRDMSLGSSFGGDNGGARIIGFAATKEGTGISGPLGALGLAEFNLGETAKATNQYSEDNIQDGGGYYDRVTLTAGAFEVKFEIPSGNTNVTNRFWSVRYMLFPRNALDISSINSCLTQDSIRTELTTNGNLYASPTTFQQGDILICQKSTSSATCADTDFQFIDSGTGALSTNRPSSPVKLNGTKILTDNSCESGTNFSVGGSYFIATLSPAVYVKKERDSNQCLYKYTLQTNCTTTSASAGSCTDSEKTGFGVDLAVNYNLQNSLFVDNSIDLDSDAEADILKQLEKILPKPLALENTKTADGTGYNTTLEASISITIDNDIATEILTAKGEKTSNYDSDFCFIKGSD